MLETINVTKSIEVESDKAWRAIASIGGLDRWFPIISSCRVEGDGVGATRILTLKDGAEMRDRVLEIDPSARRVRYERTHCPFQVTKYLGAVEVRGDAGSRSSVSWTVQIEVIQGAREELVPLIKQALFDGICGLEVELR
jgi:hypothetical protein